MIARVEHMETDLLSATSRVSRIRDIADRIRDDSVSYAVSMQPRGRRCMELSTLSGCRDFLDHFRCGVAKGVGDTLMAHDEQVTEVFLFDPTASADAEDCVELLPDANVHLLLRLRARTAALTAFVDSLDKALTASVKQMNWGIYANYGSILDVIPVTDEDMKERRGFALLFSSVIAPPIRICQGA